MVTLGPMFKAVARSNAVAAIILCAIAMSTVDCYCELHLVVTFLLLHIAYADALALSTAGATCCSIAVSFAERLLLLWLLSLPMLLLSSTLE